MKNKEKILFWIIFLCSLSVLIYRFTKPVKDISDMRNRNDNPAEKIILQGPGNFIAGKDFNIGFYDITSDGYVESNSFNINADYKISSQQFNEQNVIDLSDNVTLTMIPSKFNKIEFKENIALLHNTLGSFEVGTQLESGTYYISVDCEDNDAWFYVDGIGKAGNLTNKSKNKFTVQNNDMITFTNMNHNLTEFTYKLEKIK